MAPADSGRSQITSDEQLPVGDPFGDCRDWYVVRYHSGRSVAAEIRLIQRSAAAEKSSVQDTLEIGLRDIPRSAAPAALELLELGARLFVPIALERQWAGHSEGRRPGLRSKYRRRTNGRWILRRLPACPGYLFVRAPNDGLLGEICRATHVETVLTGAGDRPAETEPELMAALLSGVLEKDIDFRSTRFSRGDRVQVTEGPLHDLQGTIRSVSSGDRLTVLMNMFGAERAISLPTENVRKVE